MGKNTYVTRPFLPPLEELAPYLKEIWESRVLTNGGRFHQKLESELCKYLGVDHISLFSNGTLALMTGLQALGIKGEVITTPFTFVATAHSLLWNGLQPVFVDIDKDTLNLDPAKIEEAITDRTTAIMPVHCYGTPCDVDEIQRVADKHNLKVIYDAAHAFGVRCHCGSVLSHGDLSIVSFHATKVFNTFEGGAIISGDKTTKLYIDHLKNFGFDDEVTVSCNGINGKMNEFQAALGLVQLQHIDWVIEKRAIISHRYRKLLAEVDGIRCMPLMNQETSNYSYFPIFVEDEFKINRDELYERLKDAGIYARRYFYPLVTSFSMYKDLSSSDPKKLPVATECSAKVLCLPIYPELEESEQLRITGAIRTLSI